MNVYPDHVLNKQDMPWDYEALMINPNTTLELIDKLPDKAWQYDMMSLLPSLRIQDVLDRFAPDWWVGLTEHIREEHILRHPELRWDWHSISRSRYLDVAFVADHPDLPWDWDEIRYNCSRTTLTSFLA